MTAAGTGAAREWDAESYHRVSEPQLAWGRAVLARLDLRGDETVLDAGCGSGRLSLELSEAVPEGLVLPVDRSLSMVSLAAATLAGRRASVLGGDLLALPLRPACVDVVFSTATFHWVTDHDRLFGELARVLRPRGRLVAQFGAEGNVARVRALASAAARLDGLRPAFHGWRPSWRFAAARQTAVRLRRAGFIEVRTWTEERPTVLPGRTACEEFLRTAVLRPWLVRLADPEDAARFVDHVLDGLERERVPWLLDYRRLNVEARLPG